MHSDIRLRPSDWIPYRGLSSYKERNRERLEDPEYRKRAQNLYTASNMADGLLCIVLGLATFGAIAYAINALE